MKRPVDDPAAAAAATFNMTPMIDVTFQLIIVFLCSMKFRTLDQKIEAFLPKKVGITDAPAPDPVKTRVYVRLRHRPGESSTAVMVLDSRLGTTATEGVWRTVEARLKEVRGRDPAIEGEIDADPDCAHGDVVRALDSCMAAGLASVVFRGTTLHGTEAWRPRTPGR